MPSTGLDAILYDEFSALRAARANEDARIEALTADLTAAFFETSIVYVNNAGARCDDPVDILLAHLFNHQTHHRGQAHHMLSQLGAAPPPLDLIYSLREAG